MKAINKTKRFAYNNRRKVRAGKLQANPLCEHCESNGLVVAATEVDHIVPLFKGGIESMDHTINLQSLCHDCHEIKTAKDKGHRVNFGCDEGGIPLDPGHHWNK